MTKLEKKQIRYQVQKHFEGVHLIFYSKGYNFKDGVTIVDRDTNEVIEFNNRKEFENYLDKNIK